MFRSFGLPEIILILVIILIVFGVGKLPQVGGALGRGVRQFRQAVKGEDEEPAAKSEANKDAAPKA
jgi:sec-independent protein translocase protein TatA